MAKRFDARWITLLKAGVLIGALVGCPGCGYLDGNPQADALIADLAEYSRQIDLKVGSLPPFSERMTRAEIEAQARQLATELNEIIARQLVVIGRANNVVSQTNGAKRRRLLRELEAYNARYKAAVASYDARRAQLADMMKRAEAAGEPAP